MLRPLCLPPTHHTHHPPQPPPTTPTPPPPHPLQPYKDTSAGAVAADGLLRLSRWAKGEAQGRYRSAALRMLSALATGYLSSSAPAPQPASVLRNGTGAVFRGDWGTGTSYGDYYFLEALAVGRSMKLL